VSLWSIALTLFLVANPIGNVPLIVTLIKDFDLERQKRILLREAIYSYLIVLFFLFLGEQFLQMIQIQQYAVSISGGVLLFIVALNMIFPSRETNGKERKAQEPYIVPIATPLITGGGVLSTVMIYAAKEQNNMKIALAATIAWVFVTIFVVSSVYLMRLLGKSGLLAMEQLMGMILSMISVEIMVKGVKLFIEAQ
jgi:multiple antibiotic resistance protein